MRSRPGHARQHPLLAVLGGVVHAIARARPASFASYIAMSASTRSSSAVRCEAGSNSATPTLADTLPPPRPPSADEVDLADGREQALGGLERACGLDPRQDHRELVASEPGQHVGAAQAGAQRVAHAGDQLVADRMAERVVDVLEVVEVDRQDGDRAPVALGAAELTGRAPPRSGAG